MTIRVDNIGSGGGGSGVVGVLYLAEGGDDVTGDGSVLNPLRSINGAIAAINASDVDDWRVEMGPGVYTWDPMDGGLTPDAGKKIAWVGSGRDLTTIALINPEGDISEEGDPVPFRFSSLIGCNLTIDGYMRFVAADSSASNLVIGCRLQGTVESAGIVGETLLDAGYIVSLGGFDRPALVYGVTGTSTEGGVETIDGHDIHVDANGVGGIVASGSLKDCSTVDGNISAAFAENCRAENGSIFADVARGCRVSTATGQVVKTLNAKQVYDCEVIDGRAEQVVDGNNVWTVNGLRMIRTGAINTSDKTAMILFLPGNTLKTSRISNLMVMSEAPFEEAGSGGGHVMVLYVREGRHDVYIDQSVIDATIIPVFVSHPNSLIDPDRTVAKNVYIRDSILTFRRAATAGPSDRNGCFVLSNRGEVVIERCTMRSILAASTNTVNAHAPISWLSNTGAADGTAILRVRDCVIESTLPAAANTQGKAGVAFLVDTSPTVDAEFHNLTVIADANATSDRMFGGAGGSRLRVGRIRANRAVVFENAPTTGGHVYEGGETPLFRNAGAWRGALGLGSAAVRDADAWTNRPLVITVTGSATRNLLASESGAIVLMNNDDGTNTVNLPEEPANGTYYLIRVIGTLGTEQLINASGNGFAANGTLNALPSAGSSGANFATMLVVYVAANDEWHVMFNDGWVASI